MGTCQCCPLLPLVIVVLCLLSCGDLSVLSTSPSCHSGAPSSSLWGLVSVVHFSLLSWWCCVFFLVGTCQCCPLLPLVIVVLHLLPCGDLSVLSTSPSCHGGAVSSSLWGLVSVVHFSLLSWWCCVFFLVGTCQCCPLLPLVIVVLCLLPCGDLSVLSTSPSCHSGAVSSSLWGLVSVVHFSLLS